MTHLVYGLRDPRPERQGQLRYVGKSTTGLIRPKKHLLAVGLGRNTHLSKWRRKLHDLGLLDQIIIEVLEECEPEKLSEREMFWIAQFRAVGTSLVNTTAGGDGGSRKGWKHSEETKARIRVARAGRKASAETKEKMRLAHLGRKMPDHLKEKLKSIHTGRKHSEETIEKMREVHRAENLSEETRRRLSEAHRGTKASDETRAKMSESRRKENLSEETRRKHSESQRRRRARERGEQ